MSGCQVEWICKHCKHQVHSKCVWDRSIFDINDFTYLPIELVKRGTNSDEYNLSLNIANESSLQEKAESIHKQLEHLHSISIETLMRNLCHHDFILKGTDNTTCTLGHTHDHE